MRSSISGWPPARRRAASDLPSSSGPPLSPGQLVGQVTSAAVADVARVVVAAIEQDALVRRVHRLVGQVTSAAVANVARVVVAAIEQDALVRSVRRAELVRACRARLPRRQCG